MKTSAPPRHAAIRRWCLRGGLAVLGLGGILLGARLAFFQGPYLPRTAPPTLRLCDLHCHTAGLGAGDSGCFVSPRLRANPRFRIYLEAFGVTEEEVRRSGDVLILQRLSERIAASQHVGSAVVLALDGVVDAQGHLDTERTEVYIPNEFLARELPRFPNLRYGASIHPRRTNALELLDQAAREGAVLVKWIPPIMDFDPGDARWTPFYQRLRQHGLPLLVHTGRENSFTGARDELGDPARLRRALEAGVVVIAAHAGSNTAGDPDAGLITLRAMMREFPRLYVDLSSLTQVNKLGALRDTLADPLTRSRCLYGSDFPLINTALVSPWYFPLNLSRAEMERIAALPNPWDRDVELKLALGVPTEILVRTETLLHREPADRSPTGSGQGSPERAEQ